MPTSRTLVATVVLAALACVALWLFLRDEPLPPHAAPDVAVVDSPAPEPNAPRRRARHADVPPAEPAPAQKPAPAPPPTAPVPDADGPPGATFVVTDESGRPVAGADVGHKDAGAFRTGPDGRARWTLGWSTKSDATIARQSSVVRAPGFAPQQVDFTPTRGEPAEIRVVMKPGARISGRVLRADGSPGANAAIVVASASRSVDELTGNLSKLEKVLMRSLTELLVFARQATAADGTFEVVDLPDGPYLVVAMMASRAPEGAYRTPRMLRDSRTGVNAGATDVLLTIPRDDALPAHRVELVVTDTAGAAVDMCRAQAMFDGVRFRAQPTGPTRLRFDALPAGRGTIQVTADGWAAVTLTDVVIAADAPPAPIAVRMERGVTVRVVVRADSGALPDGGMAVVTAFESPRLGAEITARFKSDGSFAATGFRPGRWLVTVVPTAPLARMTSFVPVGDGSFTVPEGVSDFAVELPVVRAGQLLVQTQDDRLPMPPSAGGTTDPVKEKFGAASRLDVIDASGKIVYVHPQVYAGSGLSADLAPGEYTVRLVLAGETPQEQRCTVKAGELSRLEFPAK